MHLFTSVLLTTLLLGLSVLFPEAVAYKSSQDVLTWETHLVQKRRQPKHRGSGRRDLVHLADATIG
ncbi:MAG: hypothetical protein NW224_13885 [Leptolyngbyaceae cyanobacterium bins.302]|nr:hypothetical protein [Leptolyngbyaceae cyanobacterium bins.302]